MKVITQQKWENARAKTDTTNSNYSDTETKACLRNSRNKYKNRSKAMQLHEERERKILWGAVN